MRCRCAGAVVAVALLCLLASPLAAAESEDDALIAMERALWEGWKAHDGAPFEQHLAEGAVNTLPTGRVSGKAGQLDMITKTPCDVAGFSLGDVAVQRFGDHTAVLTYDASQDATCDGQRLPEKVMVTSVWVKLDGKWQAASYQETVPATAPTP